MTAERPIVLLTLALVFSVINAPSSNALADQRGNITTRRCPFNCRTEGIPRNVCRDWKHGEECYVEDLRRPPESSSPNVASYPDQRMRPDYSHGTDGGCRAGNYLARPRISIFKVIRTGNIFDNRYRVRGEIEGACLSEAGYFEYGRKSENIAVTHSREFRRYAFELVVDSDERPEIRVYNVNGDSDEVSLEPRDYEEENRPRFRSW